MGLQRHLIASGQIADPSAPPLTAPEEPEVVQQQVMDDARAAAIEQRLTSLEQLDRPQLPSEEALAQWARAAERVGMSHAELAATQEAVINKAEQVGTAAQNRLGELDNQQQALITTVTESVASSKDELNASILASQAQLAEFEERTEQSLLSRLKSLVVNQLPKVVADWLEKNFLRFCGLSSVTATEDPITADETWNTRWLGRSPKIGDTAWVVSRSGVTYRRYIDGGWSADAPELEPRVEVASQPLLISDQSTKVNAPITIVRSGSGGGSSGEDLLNNRMLLSTSTPIGDTSNHGGEDIRSGEFELELRALDGSLAGRTLSLITAFNYDGGVAGPTFTEYALEGSLKSVFEIDLSMYLAAASVPLGITATLPGGAQALRTSATVRPIPGVTGTGGVTRFALRGSVEYNTLATGRAYGPNEQMPSLLWHWG